MEHRHGVTICHQSPDDMRPDEHGTAQHQNAHTVSLRRSHIARPRSTTTPETHEFAMTTLLFLVEWRQRN
jgi:hypothetical protein